MQLKSLASSLSITSAIVISTFFFTNCSSMITEEQMVQIEELRRNESSLNDQIKKGSKEVSKLKSELGARETELKKCKGDREFITNELNKWPDVWPDYKPETAEEPEGQ